MNEHTPGYDNAPRAMDPAKTILIVYHSQSGATGSLAAAVEEGATAVEGIPVRRTRAHEVTVRDLVTCRALVICSPEYFGYMAGAVKDLFDRTYEEARRHTTGKSYSLVICAGNDGMGALGSIERILKGYGMRRIQEPIIARGKISDPMIEQCRTLGNTVAAGVELGIY